MFDTYVAGRTTTQLVPYEKEVHIHRQSTADDAKLLKDLEKEAWSKIQEVHLEKCQNNKFEFIKYEFAESPADLSRQTFVSFKLNDEPIKIFVKDVPDCESHSKQHERVEAISRYLAEKITEGIMKEMWRKL